MEYVEVARADSERGEIVLRQRHDPDAPEGTPAVLELRVNGIFVMDTLETSSETALARAALERVPRPHTVLIGGLGLGFTAHEVLADHRVGHVVVAEIEDALVRWFRRGIIPHGPAYLADGRLTITVADIRQVVAEAAAAAYDLVLIDVDNGPDFLVHDSNAEIYGQGFLTSVRRALRPGGELVIWSSSPSSRLEEAVAAVFGVCRPQALPVELQGRAEDYWLFAATA